MVGNPLVMLTSRGAQIRANFLNKQTGAQAIATTAMNLAGSLVRIATPIKEVGYDFVMIPDLETEVIGAGIAIREGNPELAAAMQAALDSMMDDGTYLEIANKWVGGDIR